MILQALNRYYDILIKDPDINIPHFGYSTVGVSYALNISDEGELLDLLPLYTQQQRGKALKEVPRLMIVPEYAEPTSNVEASFLCGKSEYVLGVSDKDLEKPEHSIRRHDEFRRFNLALLATADCSAARAVMAFLQTYDPANACKIPAIASSVAEIKKGRRLVFIYRNVFVHEVPAIKQVWESYFVGKDAIQGQCLVSGDHVPIALKHRKIQGRVGKEYFSSPLVSFNQRSFESYGRTEQQGLNSPIGERAAFAYAAAANYLLSDDNPNRKYSLGDAAMICWAESESRSFEAAFPAIIDPAPLETEDSLDQTAQRRAESALHAVAPKVQRTQMVDLDAILAELEGENPRFYILGLSPVGDGRLAVRFFITDLFQNITDNIMAHYRDSTIVKEYDDQPDYLTVGRILYETVSTKAKDKDASPLLAGAVFRAILTGAPYPAALYNAMLTRIRADMDEAGKRISKINYVRAAVIKAYLLRKYRHQPDHPFKEVLTVPLNEQATHPAYLLGRLFAVLEKAQRDAIPDINSTIADRYFTSACAAPASVFPTLLRLSRHHIAKAEYGHLNDKRMEDIMYLLDVERNPIPARLTLDEQGVFVLGYYHQRKELWTGRPKNTIEATETKD